DRRARAPAGVVDSAGPRVITELGEGAIDKLRISDITGDQPGGAVMSDQRPSVSRRTFLRTLGIATGGAVIAPAFVGTPATAEDVKATYERIARPPKGVVIPRTPLFATVGEIVVVDPHRIEFRMTEPRPKAYMLGAFASGWNIIVRKKTLEEHQGNLRQVMNYPGTGPFNHVSRKDKEIWVMERNPAYWNKGLPYVDRLEVYHMFPFSPELG